MSNNSDSSSYMPHNITKVLQSSFISNRISCIFGKNTSWQIDLPSILLVYRVTPSGYLIPRLGIQNATTPLESGNLYCAACEKNEWIHLQLFCWVILLTYFRVNIMKCHDYMHIYNYIMIFWSLCHDMRNSLHGHLVIIVHKIVISIIARFLSWAHVTS